MIIVEKAEWWSESGVTHVTRLLLLLLLLLPGWFKPSAWAGERYQRDQKHIRSKAANRNILRDLQDWIFVVAKLRCSRLWI